MSSLRGGGDLTGFGHEVSLAATLLVALRLQVDLVIPILKAVTPGSYSVAEIAILSNRNSKSPSREVGGVGKAYPDLLIRRLNGLPHVLTQPCDRTDGTMELCFFPLKS